MAKKKLKDKAEVSKKKLSYYMQKKVKLAEEAALEKEVAEQTKRDMIKPKIIESITVKYKDISTPDIYTPISERALGNILEWIQAILVKQGRTLR